MDVLLQGDLSFSVAGPGGVAVGRAVGDGPVLRVQTDNPVAAWAASLGSLPTGTAGVRAAVEALAAQGLSVDVAGPHGRLALVGAQADSRLGRLVTGSRRVQFGRPVALFPLAVVQARAALPSRRRTAIAVVLVAVLAILRRRRTRA